MTSSEKNPDGRKAARRLRLTRGSLLFGVLVTYLTTILVGVIAVLSGLYALTVTAPLLAGFVIGYCASKERKPSIRTAFKGTFTASLILLALAAIPIAFLATELQYALRIYRINVYAIAVLLLLTPFVIGALGALGGLISSILAKRLKGRRLR